MGANTNGFPPAKVPRRVAPKLLNFPTVHMEDTEAELWLAAHGRLVKAAHAADKYLVCSATFKWKIDFNCPTLKEFRAAVAEIKDREANGGL